MNHLSSHRHDSDHHEDRGASTILIVIMMPLLVFFGALVFDGGRGVLARRQTQNAADAGALAKAQDCALGINTTNFTAYQTNGAVLANTPTCGNGVTTVTMSKVINFIFRPDLPGGSATVTRSATARWGVISSGNTAPVTISRCSFDQATNSGTTFPSAEINIPLGSGSGACAIGGRPPGAFGWIDGSGCSIPTTLNSSGQLVVHGQNGNGNGNGWNCITVVGVNGTLLIPVYGANCKNPSPCVAGQNNGVGNNLYYLILGYAEIQITGWDLQHGSPKKAGAACGASGSASCIRGRFIKFTTTQGSVGPATNFGVTKVYLSLT